MEASHQLSRGHEAGSADGQQDADLAERTQEVPGEGDERDPGNHQQEGADGKKEGACRGGPARSRGRGREGRPYRRRPDRDRRGGGREGRALGGGRVACCQPVVQPGEPLTRPLVPGRERDRFAQVRRRHGMTALAARGDLFARRTNWGAGRFSRFPPVEPARGGQPRTGGRRSSQSMMMSAVSRRQCHSARATLRESADSGAG